MSTATAATSDKQAVQAERPQAERGEDAEFASPHAELLALQASAGNRAVHGLLGGGQPLPPELRAEMEAHFGQDFSQVRLHIGPRAAASAQALAANAYTHGRDIVFGQGRYAPETGAGKRLLAHELAHVVQQSRGGGTPALDPHSALERAAGQAAEGVARGGPVAVRGASGVGVQREPADEPEVVPITGPMRQELIAFWEQKFKRARKKENKDRYQSYIDVLKKGDRPHWRQSELDMLYFYRQIGASGQRIYFEGRRAKQVQIDGKWRPPEGSVVPDMITSSAMFEVKNYELKNKAKLINKLRSQIRKRARVGDYNLKTQAIILDLRGQHVSMEEIRDLAKDVARATGLPVRNIQVLVSRKPPERRGPGSRSAARPTPSEADADPETEAGEPGRAKAAPSRRRGARSRAEVAADEDAKEEEPAPSKRSGRGKGAGKEARRGKGAADAAAAPAPAPAPGKRPRRGKGAAAANVAAAPAPAPAPGKRPRGRKGAAAPAAAANVAAAPAPAPAPGKRPRRGKGVAAPAAAVEVAEAPAPAPAPGKRPRRGKGAAAPAAAAEVSETAPAAAPATSPRRGKGAAAPAPGPDAPGRPAPSDRRAARKPATAAPIGADPDEPPLLVPRVARPRAPRRSPAQPAPAPAQPAPAPAQSPSTPAPARPAPVQPAPAQRPSAPAPARPAPVQPAPVPAQKPAAPARRPPAPRAKSAPVQPPPHPVAPTRPAPPRGRPSAPRGGAKQFAPAGPANQEPTPAPNTSSRRGALAQAGNALLFNTFQRQQDHGGGLRTHQTVSGDSRVRLTVEEQAGSNPPTVRVSVQIDLNTTVGAGGSLDRGGRSGHLSVGASGSLVIARSRVLPQAEAQQYIDAVHSRSGGRYEELRVLQMVASSGLAAAQGYLRNQKDPFAGMAEGEERSISTAREADLSAGGGLGDASKPVAKGGGTSVGVSASLSKGVRIDKSASLKDGRYLFHLLVTDLSGGSLGASFQQGVASMGLTFTKGSDRSAGITLSIGENEPERPAVQAEVQAVQTMADLQALLQRRRKLVSSQQTGWGESRGMITSASVAGMGINLHNSGRYGETVIHDEQGDTHVYEGSGTGGAEFTVGGHRVASDLSTDSFTGQVGPDGRATGETRSDRHQASLNLFGAAKARLSGALGGKVEASTSLMQERTDSAGAFLSDNSFTRLSLLAEDPVAWAKSWPGKRLSNRQAWVALRPKILAAKGNRDQISKLLAQFESEDDDRSGIVEKAVGETGVAFEFPDELADQKPVFQSLVLVDPRARAQELVRAGNTAQAIAELNSANAQLGALAKRLDDYKDKFERPTTLADMLSRISARRTELRAELRKLTPPPAAAAKPAEPFEQPKEGATVPTADQMAALQAQAEQQREDRNARLDDLLREIWVLQAQEEKLFAEIDKEYDRILFHPDHVKIGTNLTSLTRLYEKWEVPLGKLRALYQERGESPDRANQFGPNRARWQAANSKYQKW